MTSKHTSGPWAMNGTRVEHETDHGWINDGWIICECYGPDDEANARLVAAAPALLDALISARNHLRETLSDRRIHPIGHCPTLDFIEGVIAKAIGESRG